MPRRRSSSRGRHRCEAEGLSRPHRVHARRRLRHGPCERQADFVWGEDAWCYVVDKKQLIAEAVRLVKPGGMIAFTDWIEGPARSHT